MSRTLHTILRGGLGAILIAGATIAACGHAAAPEAVHPLGESTAPLPANAAAPLIDAPGVPQSNAPTPPVAPPSGAWGESPRAVDIAMADEFAVDAGLPQPPGVNPGPGSNVPRPTNPPNAPRPTNPGNGSGSGGNPLPPPTGPATPPKAPAPTQPPPGPGTPPSTPTPGPR